MVDKKVVHLRVGVGTHVGKVRSRNEDAVFADDKKALFFVADGMGGHQAGEVASRVALETITTRLPVLFAAEGSARIRQILEEIIIDAHEEILRRSCLMDDLKGMGTTVVLTQVLDTMVYVASVGDSRAYLFRNGVLKQLTDDHSVAARMVREGELDANDARHHPMHSVLYNVLGQDGQAPDVDVVSVEHNDGDALLLCTDGLTDEVEDREIGDIIVGGQSAQEACDQLIETANRNGGKDNITAIVVWFGGSNIKSA